MIHYIIASFSGKTDSRKHLPESEKVLAIQLDTLRKIFSEKKYQNIRNLISQITIVVPTCKIESYKDYYDTSINEIEGIPIQYLTYVGSNKDHSYDQWLQGIMYNKDAFSYYLLIEDDYCIDTSNLYFDKELVDIYNASFKDKKNIGYLSTLVLENPFKHAAISNGIISKETVDYIHLRTGHTILDEYYTLSGYPQLKFSQLFNDMEVCHSDLKGHYCIYFWDTPSQKIIDFSTEKDCTKLSFIPCQYIYNTSYSTVSAKILYENIKNNIYI